ncbi:MAG TPA: hypothetical protein VNI01_05155 [Elusimicrobiota bacterium]|jgi:hypothetical protein|nr:hypothetical protein [Elusimicrobiota bacterium]
MLKLSLDKEVDHLVDLWSPQGKQFELYYKYKYRKAGDDMLAVTASGVFSGQTAALLKDLKEDAPARANILDALFGGGVPVAYIAFPLVAVYEMGYPNPLYEAKCLAVQGRLGGIDDVILGAMQALGPGPARRIAQLAEDAQKARQVSAQQPGAPAPPRGP